MSASFVPVTGDTRPLDALLPDPGPPVLVIRGKRLHIVDELEQDWEIRVGTVEKVGRGFRLFFLFFFDVCLLSRLR